MGGIGYATTVITFLMNMYYIVILAWSLYFMFMSFSDVLPWSHCENPWNTANCFYKGGAAASGVVGNAVVNTSSMTDGGVSEAAGSVAAVLKNASAMVDPAVEFWERKVLHLSQGVDEMGSIVPELALCLFIVWVLVFFALFKGECDLLHIQSFQFRFLCFGGIVFNVSRHDHTKQKPHLCPWELSQGP